MKSELHQKADKLRKSGYSFREISEELGVSKSTASLWTRRDKMTSRGKIRLHNLLVFSQIKARKILLDKQEQHFKDLEANCRVLKNGRQYKKDDYKLFLALLYWGEGSKTNRRLSLINSDPEMVRIYLKLLRAAFDIREEKLSALLHLHDYHNRPEMLAFWSKVTGIDKKRISIYNKKNTGIQKKAGYRGCIAVCYGDYRIFDEMMLIIKRFIGLKI